ncbi:MAG: hypothetical protein EOO68_15375, partial [Moraxellaceae bacterium]
MEPLFLLSGNLPGLDITPWKKVQQRYVDYGVQIDAETSKVIAIHNDDKAQTNADGAEENSMLVAGLPFRAQVLVAHYQVGPLALDDVKVRAERLAGAWKVSFTNPLLDGDVRLPVDTSKPL